MTMRCPACASPMRRLGLPLERATLALCDVCGHGITTACSRHLGAAEYATAPGEREAFERCYLPARLRSYERGLELLGPSDGRLILDFGSNYGHFLALAAARGWRVVGVEPGAALRDQSVERVAGAAVSSLEEASTRGPFDAVTLWDVLEHLPGPEQYLQRLAGVLAPGGRLLLRVPDARVFGALRSGPAWRALEQAYLTLCHPTNPEEHVSHFTPASVRRMAAGAGLRERVTLDAAFDERVAAGRTRLDAVLRRGLHTAGRRLPYEFTMSLELTRAR